MSQESVSVVWRGGLDALASLGMPRSPARTPTLEWHYTSAVMYQFWEKKFDRTQEPQYRPLSITPLPAYQPQMVFQLRLLQVRTGCTIQKTINDYYTFQPYHVVASKMLDAPMVSSLERDQVEHPYEPYLRSTVKCKLTYVHKDVH